MYNIITNGNIFIFQINFCCRIVLFTIYKTLHIVHGTQQKRLCRGLSPVPLSLKNISKFILKYFLVFIVLLVI